jgi:ABC-type uncharacterized transport system auxiliary subunit
MRWNWIRDEGVGMRLRAGLAGLLCLLSACSSLLDSKTPPWRVYQLESYRSAEPLAKTTAGTLAIRVSTSPGLDTDRLLTQAPDSSTSRISGARWPDYLPEMSVALLRESFDSSGLFSRVIEDPVRASYDCLLDLRVDRFHTRLNNEARPEQVELAYAGTVRCFSEEHSIMFSESSQVRGTRVQDVVAAYQAAFDGFSRTLVERLVAILDAPTAETD